MKIKNLLLLGLCSLTTSLFAADEGTVMFYEDFGTNEYHQGSALNNGHLSANTNTALDAYKVEGSFYFDEQIFIHGDWGVVGTYPGASQGSALGLNFDDWNKEINIKVNTSSKPYVLFIYAHSKNAWSEGSSDCEASYSFDNGSTWTVFNLENANIVAGGPYNLIQHAENIGGKECVYLKLKFTMGSGMVDDVQVIGYDAVPVDKFSLSGAIASAQAFVNEAIMDAAYCMTDILNFQNSDIAAAQTVYNNAEATQTDVDNATSTLNAALEAIQATKLDFEAINAAITAAQAKMAEDGYAELYTEESRTIMENALTAAQQITEAGCVSQEDVNTAATTLSEAVNNLQNTAIDGDAAVAEINLYPSPADNFIKIDGVEGVTVNIFNSVGQLVKSVANYNGGTISISNLASGVYSAVINDTAISFIKK